MVVPMPTAKPLTAATMGLAAVLIVSKNCWAGRGPPPAWVRLAKSVRSLPLVKESAVPVSRMTRMVSSLAAVCKACAISAYITWVRAFFLLGRFIWMVRTPSRVVVRMSVVIRVIRYWLFVICAVSFSWPLWLSSFWLFRATAVVGSALLGQRVPTLHPIQRMRRHPVVSE